MMDRAACAVSRASGRAALIALVALVAMSCSSGSSAQDEGPAASDTTASPTTTGVPITVPPASDGSPPDVAAIVLAVQPQLAINDAEAACLGGQLETNPDLTDKLRTGATPGTVEFTELAALAAKCQTMVTFAPKFAEGINQQNGNTLTAEQTDCLSTKFGALSSDDLNAIMGAGLNPTGPQGAKGQDLLATLVESCGVSRPG